MERSQRSLPARHFFSMPRHLFKRRLPGRFIRAFEQRLGVSLLHVAVAGRSFSQAGQQPEGFIAPLGRGQRASVSQVECLAVGCA